MFEIPETYFTVQEQTRLFFYACLMGIPLGLLYDGFRMLRVLFHHHAVAVALEDILFLFAFAVFLAGFTSLFCRGEFRVFYIIGALLGFVLYRTAIGNPLLRSIRRIAEKIRTFFRVLFHPFRLFFARFHAIFHTIFQHTLQIPKNAKKKCRFLLIADPGMLYNKRKQYQEVNGNDRCSKTKTAAAKTTSRQKRRRAIQPAGKPNRKEKKQISI